MTVMYYIDIINIDFMGVALLITYTFENKLGFVLQIYVTVKINANENMIHSL